MKKKLTRKLRETQLRRLALLMLTLLAVAPSALADRVEDHGIWYEVSHRYFNGYSQDVACVTYAVPTSSDDIPPTANTEYYVGNIVIPESIEYNGKTYPVKYIDSYAFNTCTKLTSISLPSTLTHIYSYAFRNCASLESITGLSAITYIGDYAFYNCTSLKSIEDLPALPSINNYAFQNCTSLESVGDMPELTVLNYGIFYNCGKLQSVGEMPKLTSIGGDAFRNCVNLKAIGDLPSLTSLNYQAFYECAKLESIGEMPLVKTIGSSAFAYCSSLKRIGDLPNLSSLDSSAFYECSSLESVGNVPKLTYLSSSVFSCCTSLTSVDFPNLKSISNHSFYGCTSLQSVDFPLVETIGYSAFRNCTNLKEANFQSATQILGSGGNDGAFQNCINLQSVEFPALTSIAEYVFYGCTSLQSVDFPSLSSIGSQGFYNCTSLQSVDFPKLTSIESECFRGCSSLASVNCPNVASIENYAFYGCSSLASVDCPKVASIGYYAFYGCSSLASVNCPNVASIGYYAFYGCSSLASVNCPNVASIGNNAFIDCSSLAAVDCPNLTSIGYQAFFGCTSLASVNFPLLTSLNYSTFRNCLNLKEIRLPNLTNTYDADRSEYSVFYGCTALETIELPLLTELGGYTFYGCNNLKSITFPNVVRVGGSAFYNTAISEFYFPESLESVYTSSFSYPKTVHFAGEVPPTFTSSSIETTIFVPKGCVQAYSDALPDMVVTKILEEGVPTSYDVTVEALETGSGVLEKVNEGSQKDIAHYAMDLKVSGSINSYDIMVMRNKMLNLRNLDLSDATIVANPYQYVSGYNTTDSVIGNGMFQGLKLLSIKLPKSIKKIGGEAFRDCSYISDIIIPEGVTTINNAAFYGCSSLKNIKLPETLQYIYGSYPGTFGYCLSLSEIAIPPYAESIPSYCFYGCNKLESISLPPTLKSIGENAFSSCSSLKEFRIPAGVTSIGNSAIPSTVKDVYTYTIQPTNIGQDTFASSTYLTATLHVPETSEQLYYWDTQWSQFQSITNFNEPYSYFYLADKDLIEDPDTPRIEGEGDENPDADLGQGSGLVVEGDDSQNLGNVDLEHNGNGEGASIIGGDSNSSETGGNINIDMLNIKINVNKNKWYFFSFPFDVKCSDIKFNGQMVWRYYDGEIRALQGSGAWKDNKEDYLRRGIGYIFQGSKDGTLELSIPNASFDASDWEMELTANVSAAAEDASWNFIGNPFQSYYELADLGFDGPITVWNPDTKSYEAFSPIDDDMTMYPFMAFFVQKPEGTESLDFDAEYRETGNQAKDENNRKNARARRNARTRATATERLLVNLTVTDGEVSDRTRIVFNDAASLDYEVGVDASKFLSGEAPQIYSLNGANVRFAINERPTADGTVRLGFYAPASAVYTIEGTRTDCPVVLNDLRAGKSIDLAPGTKYQFTADQGYDDGRFTISLKPDGTTSLDEAAAASDADYYQFNGQKTDGSARGMLIEKSGKDVKKVIK